MLTHLVFLAASTIAAISGSTRVPGTPPRSMESIWYIRNDTAAISDFAAHAKQIDVIAPQVYSIDSLGAIRGGMAPRMVEIARANNVKLMPLVMNPGFDLAILHRIVTDPVARTASAHGLAQLCRETQVWGIQLDFENLHVSDRDAFTAFAREAADSVHAAKCTLSAAVVPRTSDTPGALPYHQWIHEYWRAAYDYKALASVLDFLSYMTYAQHTGGSTPGPVAGYPWMLAGLKYVLAQGVPPSKLSLGVAGYSDYWYPGYTAKTGDSRPRGEDIAYTRLAGIMKAAGARVQWDPVQKAGFAMWERDGVFEHAWIEDARAFGLKMGLARTYGLRGYSVWLLGLEDPGVWRLRLR